MPEPPFPKNVVRSRIQECPVTKCLWQTFHDQLKSACSNSEENGRLDGTLANAWLVSRPIHYDGISPRSYGSIPTDHSLTLLRCLHVRPKWLRCWCYCGGSSGDGEIDGDSLLVIDNCRQKVWYCANTGCKTERVMLRVRARVTPGSCSIHCAWFNYEASEIG